MTSTVQVFGCSQWVPHHRPRSLGGGAEEAPEETPTTNTTASGIYKITCCSLFFGRLTAVSKRDRNFSRVSAFGSTVLISRMPPFIQNILHVLCPCWLETRHGDLTSVQKTKQKLNTFGCWERNKTFIKLKCELVLLVKCELLRMKHG